MKRFIAFLTAAVTVLTMLSACGKKNTEKANKTNLDYYKDMSGVDEDIGLDIEDPNAPQDKEFDSDEFEIIDSTTGQSSSAATQNNTNNHKPSTGNDDSPLNTPTQEEITKDNLITAETVIDFETDERTKGDSDASYDDTPSKKEIKYHEWVEANIGDTLITEAQFDTDKLALPRLVIDTLDGKDVTSRSEYKSALITIENAKAQYCIQNRQVEIRGRGNSTWMYFDKKPYKLNFNTKIDLFGFGGNKKYVLLANAMDETNIRTYLAFHLAHEFGIEYATDYQMVHVILNGDYRGMYMMCEQVSEGQARVDIKTSKTGEVDTGYLVESINSGENDGYKVFKLPELDGKHVGKNPNSHTFIIKSPGKDVTADQQIFIKDYISQVNTAIFTKNWKKFTELCDVDSFVNMTLVNAIIMNNDYGYSFYMYKKKGGKLYLGPIWDFDQSSGSSTHGGTTYRGWYAGSEPRWQTALLEIPEFKALVEKRYKEKHAVVKGLVSVMEKAINDYEFDFAMNNLERNNKFALADRWRIPPSIAKLDTYKKHVSALKTWLLNRQLWLDDQLNVK